EAAIDFIDVGEQFVQFDRLAFKEYVKVVSRTFDYSDFKAIWSLTKQAIESIQKCVVIITIMVFTASEVVVIGAKFDNWASVNYTVPVFSVRHHAQISVTKWGFSIPCVEVAIAD